MFCEMARWSDAEEEEERRPSRNTNLRFERLENKRGQSDLTASGAEKDSSWFWFCWRGDCSVRKFGAPRIILRFWVL